MGNSKELVNLSLQEIVQPIDQLGPNSLVFGSLLQKPIHSPPQSPPQIKDGNVNENVAPMNPNPPLAWIARSPFKMACPLHNFPQNADKSLPKFYPREGIYVDDHVQSFFLAV